MSPKDEGYKPVIHRAKPTVIHTIFDWSTALFCPFCRHSDSRVVDSRATDDGSAIRRRRQCPECDLRFTTIEVSTLSVVKRSGVIEPFSRAKVVNGLRKACQGRPVTDDDLALLAQKVEIIITQHLQLEKLVLELALRENLRYIRRYFLP